MKTILETEDIEQIALKLLESLKPFLHQKQSTHNNDSVFNVKDLSQYLHVSKSWLYQRTRLQQIPYIKIDGQLLFKKSKIDQWLEAHQVPTIPTGMGSYERRRNRHSIKGYDKVTQGA